MAEPVRLTVLVGLAALIVCGVAAFNSHRTAHGTRAEERVAYEFGEGRRTRRPAQRCRQKRK